MQIKIRTTTGWVEYDEWGAASALSCNYHQVGPHVIEHNAFMNKHYPLPKEGKNADAADKR